MQNKFIKGFKLAANDPNYRKGIAWATRRESDCLQLPSDRMERLAG